MREGQGVVDATPGPLGAAAAVFLLALFVVVGGVGLDHYLRNYWLYRGVAQPLILVMPFGSTGTFTDKEWVNGYRAHENWETFVARDVVRAIDARFRTIPIGSGRALAGLSEGGYASLNIGLHHPREFSVLE